jgi:ubiquinol-cytochrome c reductase cytochrome b subunit
MNININMTAQKFIPPVMPCNKQNKENLWNEYLAGLIDGDGCFLLSPKNYASLEITMSIYDEHLLNTIKQKLGGSVKPRKGIRALRYRLHHKKGILELLSRVNGFIRNSKRISQLQKLCSFYNIPFQTAPALLTINSAWFAGFFDADGTLSYSMKGNMPQLVLSVSNKKSIDLEPFKQVFGGYIQFDKRSNTYKWEIYTEKDIFNFCDYLKKNPLRSYKRKRIFLVKRYFELRAALAFRQPPTSLLFKAWNLFEKKWNSF